MDLLQLPPEILQELLRCCTTPSFFHLIRTCKRLHSLAASRHVLLHHLEATPGITLGLQDPKITTQALFQILRRRGAAHLYGANLMADRTDFLSKLGTINVNTSSIFKDQLALVLNESLQVRIYGVLSDGACELKSILGGPLAGGIGKILKVVPRGEVISILYSRTPETSGVASRASSPQIDAGNDDGPAQAQVDTGFESLRIPETAYFVHHHDSTKGDFATVWRIPPPSPWLGRKLIPIDFAVVSLLHCAVLWDLPGSVTPTIFAQVIVYYSKKSKNKAFRCYNAERIWPVEAHPVTEQLPQLLKAPKTRAATPAVCTMTPSLREDVSERTMRTLRSDVMCRLPRSIAYSHGGRKIKLFAAGAIIPYDVISTASTCKSRGEIQPDPVLHRPAPWFPLSDDDDDDQPYPFSRTPTAWFHRKANGDFILTTPFTGVHEMKTVPILNTSTDVCTFSYLSLGTTGFLKPGTKQRTPIATILCLILTSIVVDAGDCDHEIALDQCHAGERKVVARLWGWRPAETSLTGEGMLACCDTRIAVADWDRIMIWSLSPKALIDEADDPGPPRQPSSANADDADDDDSDSDVSMPDSPDLQRKHRCNPAWTYPKVYDGNLETWLVELKPIVVHAEQVIHQLTWKDPNTLIARTEMGLQVWNVGASATQKRAQGVLKMSL